MAAGTVARIRVENFMCHAHLETKLVPNVNFVVGQNGSGKSALLTALVVCLGASARSTFRANSMAQFIKHGCTYAVAEVTLRNTLPDAYRHDVFGDEITVERRINTGSSTFRLKDAAGKTVSKGRAELDKLLDLFNIDVSNPINVMGQDASRVFLHQGTDTEKFQFFTKATLLDRVMEYHRLAQETVREFDPILELERTDVEREQHKLAEYEHQLQGAQQLTKLRQKQHALINACAWAMVYEEDARLEEVTARQGSLNAEIVQLEEAVTIAKDEKAAAEEGVRVYREELAELTVAMEAHAEEKNVAQKAFNDASKAKNAAKTDKMNTEQKMTSTRNRRKEIERQIAEVQEKAMQSTQDQRRAKELAVTEQREAVSVQEANVLSLQTEERNSRASAEEAKTVADDLHRKMGQLDSSIREKERHLNQMRNQQRNQVNAFGDKMSTLLDKINHHAQRFKELPIGPIGSLLGLRDARWNVAVEEAAGRLMEAFVVGSAQDAKTLRDLMKDLRMDNTVITYRLNTPRYDLPAHKLPADDLLTVLRVLQFRNDVAFNILVDHGGVERQVLVENHILGKRIGWQRGNNVKECFTPEGEKFYLRGNSEINQQRQGNRPPRLGVDAGQQIPQLEHEVHELQNSKPQLEQERHTAEEQARQLMLDIQAVQKQRREQERKLSNLRGALQRAENQLMEEAATDEVDVSELDEGLKECDVEMENFEHQLEELNLKLEKLQLRFETKRGELDAVTAKGRESAESNDRVTNNLNKALHIFNACNQRLLDKEADQHKCLDKIAKFEQRVQEIISHRQVVAQEATGVCAEDDVDQTLAKQPVERLNRQLESTEAFIQREEQRMGMSLKDLESKTNTQRVRTAKRRRELEQAESCRTALDESLAKRNKSIRALAAQTRGEVAHKFNSFMSRRGLTGKVEVDFEKQTCQLVVNTARGKENAVRDTKGLSGGERSFSTMSFTLALGCGSESPFRAMDEFDIFMDPIARRIAVDEVIRYALDEKPDVQFLFLTPQGVSDVKVSNLVKIQQMAQPRP